MWHCDTAGNHTLHHITSHSCSLTLQGLPIWSQIGLSWHQMWLIKNFSRQYFSIFWISELKFYWKLILKSPRFSPIWFQFGPNSNLIWHPCGECCQWSGRGSRLDLFCTKLVEIGTDVRVLESVLLVHFLSRRIGKYLWSIQD